MSREAGTAALRQADYAKAETLFIEAADELGQGEALYDQHRYDEAEAIFARHSTDGRAKLFLGLIACKRGDHAGAEALLTEAKALGNRPAERLLLVKDWWEKV